MQSICIHFQSLSEAVERSKANLMNTKAISVHHCRFSPWVVLALSKEGGAGTVLGLFHLSHNISSSWRLPLDWVRISACWTKQGALRRDNRQEDL